MKSVGVLGGGISGLSAAYYLKNLPLSVKLFEGSERLGGWIKSSRSMKGHIFECGPRTLRPRGPAGENTLTLINEIGLAEKIVFIPRSHPAAINRLIYVNKNLHILPSSLLSMVVKKTPFSKPLISAAFQDLKALKKEITDESIYDFTERRFGKEIADLAISPMICGICAGNAKEISVKFLMTSLFEAEQKHGSVIKGLIKDSWKKRKYEQKVSKNKLSEKCRKEKWSVYSFQEGLETLPKALAKEIEKEGTEIHLQAQCQKISFHPDKVVVTANHKEYEFDQVISSLSAQHLAPLLKEQHPLLSKELEDIPHVNVGVVNLQYSGKVLKTEAFGFLVPPSQNLPILGIIFDSCCFPNKEDTIITVMMGGYWFEQHFGKSPLPDDLLETAVKYANSILGIDNKPETHKVSILNQCIPQYVVGHYERLRNIRSYIKTNKLQLEVCGSSYDGIGVNDVILSARNAVSSIISI